MGYNNNLKQILIDVSGDKLTYVHIVELVKISRIIATSFIKNKKPSSILFAYKNGIDLSDLISDIIADIFEKGSDDNIYKINNFILSLKEPLASINSSELFRAYYSFVTKLASVQLARLYAAYDPSGQKIKRNIREVIAQMEKFEVYKTKSDTIYLIKNCERDSKRNYLMFEEFEKEFLSLSAGRKSTRELFEVIYNMLVHQESYRKEIRLNDIVTMFKSYYGYEEKSVTGGEEENLSILVPGDNFANKFEIEQLCTKVIEKIKGKIFIDYFSKGKLNREQAIGLADAIEEIIADWIHGQTDLTYYQYLSRFVDLTKEEYELCFKAKLEYLIKESKRQIALYFEP